MRIWKETLTVLAISRMDKDKVGVAGLNEYGQWLRLHNLYLRDLEVDSMKLFKLFGRTKVYVYQAGFSTEEERPEDREVFWHDDNKPLFLDELAGHRRKIYLDQHLKRSVAEIFSLGNTIGLIKPIVDTVEFKINPYLKDYEASFTFHDEAGDCFTFPCTEIHWRNFWLHWVQGDEGQQGKDKQGKELLQSELLKMQWLLNEQDTYFVIGLTRPVEEWPGAFGGCWPMVLGVITLSVPDYIRDYNM